MARRDVGSKRGPRPPSRPLDRSRTYSEQDFQRIPGDPQRRYVYTPLGEVVSRRQRDEALRGFLTNEFVSSRNKPSGIPYQTALRRYTERHANQYGRGAGALARAEQSSEWQSTWKDLVRGHASYDPQTRSYHSHRAWKRQQNALQRIFGPYPDPSDRSLWRNTVSPKQSEVA